MKTTTTTEIVFTNKSGDYIGTCVCRDPDMTEVCKLAAELYQIKVDNEEHYRAIIAAIEDVKGVL